MHPSALINQMVTNKRMGRLDTYREESTHVRDPLAATLYFFKHHGLYSRCTLTSIHCFGMLSYSEIRLIFCTK
jgi:hypothetical protein